MLRFIFRFLFWIKGWKVENLYPNETERCVMTAAPHTSNWDLVMVIAAFEKIKVPLRFTIKKEWLKFPVGLFIKPLGAIAINRSPKVPGEARKSMVEAMADLFEQQERIALVITPEGTRKKVSELRTGFYHLALKAKVPIALGYADYAKKIAGIGKVIYPTGDYEKDVQEIKAFYATISAADQKKNSFI